MAKIGRFEELQSWQKGRQLANSVYDLTEHPKSAKDFRLSGQIQDVFAIMSHLHWHQVPVLRAAKRLRSNPLSREDCFVAHLPRAQVPGTAAPRNDILKL